jgi:hypothetical protein
MLVYGDRTRAVSPRAELRALGATLAAAARARPGPGRHDRLTRAFLDAAALAQGLADADWAARGGDGLSPLQDDALALLVALARQLAQPAGAVGADPAVGAALAALARHPLPETLAVRLPEGHAFYAVYPEAYRKAAAAHPWAAPPFVVGLRSAGTGLAAVVAAATGAARVVTLRPTGHPFRRELRVRPALRARLARHPGPFAVVDEGPGLSGSSFGAVADLLAGLGVAEERVVFLPSHRGGPGPQASAAHRARWERAPRAVATLDDLVGDEPLAGWFADLTGPVAAVDDLSGGAWRAAAGLPPEAWPPVHAALERRKFRLRTAAGDWLARFAGLGCAGEARWERARALHAAGFGPAPLGLRLDLTSQSRAAQRRRAGGEVAGSTGGTGGVAVGASSPPSASGTAASTARYSRKYHCTMTVSACSAGTTSVLASEPTSSLAWLPKLPNAWTVPNWSAMRAGRSPLRWTFSSSSWNPSRPAGDP